MFDPSLPPDRTGGRARLPGIDLCGKTGSAQLASNDYLKGASARGNLKDNAWFEGYAPCHDPEIVVVAFYEHGEHGQFAAPIVRDVIKAYFDKKARLSAAAQRNRAKLSALLAVTDLGLPRIASLPK